MCQTLISFCILRSLFIAWKLKQKFPDQFKMTFSEIKINFPVFNGQIFFSNKSKSHQILILPCSKYVARNVDECLKICASYCNLWSDFHFKVRVCFIGVTHPSIPTQKTHDFSTFYFKYCILRLFIIYLEDPVDFS
jgi:hypothetical protein